jgi:hypothetical protein
MQHHGGRSKDGRKVELLCYQVKKGPDWEKYNGTTSYDPRPNSTTFTEPTELDSSGNPHLWRFFREPAGMCGCWVVFKYNGQNHVPDLSVPISLFSIPKDAEKLSDEESVKHWKS